jgi:NADH-quinone oxidoreductase subunit C
MSTGETFITRLKSQLGDAITGSNLTAIDPWIEVAPAKIVEVCTYLRDQADLRFDFLSCITAVDYLETDPKKAAKIDWQPHLELIYHLYSTVHKRSIVVKVMLPRWKNDTPGEMPCIDTVSNVWRTADWHEREVYDLSGVYFNDHPDFRRILCPEDWEGYPLRKDYEMPLEYHGIRGR